MMMTSSFLSLCQNRKTRSFDAKRFVAVADSIATRAAARTRATGNSVHIVSISRVKDVLLGRGKLEKCACCSAFRLVRSGATCSEMEHFDNLLRRLAGDARCGDQCRPGDDELATGDIRAVGANLHVHVGDCGSGASIAWRLQKLAAQLRDVDDCVTCRLVLELKCVLLLMILSSNDERPRSSACKQNSRQH